VTRDIGGLVILVEAGTSKNRTDPAIIRHLTSRDVAAT
jgi:hypothetical protein